MSAFRHLRDSFSWFRQLNQPADVPPVTSVCVEYFIYGLIGKSTFTKNTNQKDFFFQNKH